MLDVSKTAPVKLEGKTNTPDEVLDANTQHNMRRQLPQVQPHEVNPDPALLVCSGPSLLDTERDLIKAQWAGGKVVAVNGAYQWCIDRGIKPSAAVILDARQSCARFVAEEVPGCKYLLASQCHPDVFDICEGRNVHIWHACSGGDEEHERLKQYYWDRVYPVTIGTTVGIRSISLLRMLGFVRLEIFGLDSCFLDGAHHAFDQAENQKDKSFPVWLRPEDRDDLARQFHCAPWHMKQVEDFQKLIIERGDYFNLHIHGDGLLAHMLRTGAQIHTEN